MSEKSDAMLHQATTEKIIKSFYNVYNTLGFGFLEKIYENSMLLEMQRNGLKVQKQFPVKVCYLDVEVGNYFVDILVNDCVVVELKAAEVLHEDYSKQLINYLKATDLEIGLLLNFGVKPEFRRKIFTNNRKIN